MQHINGQHQDLSIETVLLSEPCYHNFLLAQDNLRSRMFQDALKRFMALTKRLSNLKLKVACQNCAARPATIMAVEHVDKTHMKLGNKATIKQASKVKFVCETCRPSTPGTQLRPSTLAWPAISPNDKIGAYVVRTALLAACGFPQLHHSDQEDQEAFFADDDNFLLPVQEKKAA